MASNPPFDASSWNFLYQTPTWDGGGCLTNTGYYDDVYMEATGTWAAGYRPAALTVDGTNLLQGADSYISVVDNDEIEIGRLDTFGLAPPFIVPLTFGSADINRVVLADASNSDPGYKVCTVSFSGVYAQRCWTNHNGQIEA